MAKTPRQDVLFDVRAGCAASPPAQNLFDLHEHWIGILLTLVFVICGMVSGYATFVGIRLFLFEIGDIGLLTNGTSIILTIAVSAILTVGWAVMYRYGPEARTGLLKSAMFLLAVLLFAITLSVSSLSNLMALVGPAAKVHDWRVSHANGVQSINTIGNRALAIGQLRPGWEAARESACRLAKAEETRGAVSTVGGGVGPVSVALTGVCAQTEAFLAAMSRSTDLTRVELVSARAALGQMRLAIRNRKAPVIVREDAFLDGGEALNIAVQNVRAADLTGVLESGAAQVEASVAELSASSAFDQKQIEMVASVKDGLSGLVESTRAISARQLQEHAVDYQPVRSPDFIAAILTHSERFIPVFAAAIAIDAFQMWAMLFVLVSKAGKVPARLRGDFDRLIESDTLTPLQMLEPDDPPKPSRWSWLRRKTKLN